MRPDTKPRSERQRSPHEAYAHAKNIRVSPFKARQVARTLRGKPVGLAALELSFSPKGAAEPILKCLNSAVANAENNHDLNPEDLIVLLAEVDEGPTLKRIQPRAMGRAYRIRKRTSHIKITVGLPAELRPKEK